MMKTRQRDAIIVAVLDLENENERIVHGWIQRMHSGRSPALRALTMRQEGGNIIEAAQWHPCSRQPPRFSVVRWSPSELSVSWRDMPSKKVAMAAALDVFETTIGVRLSPSTQPSLPSSL